MDITAQTLHNEAILEDEGRFQEYEDALAERFYASQEWKATGLDGEETWYWAGHLIHYSGIYLGIPLAKLDEADLHQLLFSIFPRKISLNDPHEAQNTLPEIIGFWHFLKREYGLPNADSNLRFLEDIEVQEFIDAMFDPANFGMAKSFFMSGMAAGYDMTNQDELDAYMHVHNAEIMASGPRPAAQPMSDQTLAELLLADQLINELSGDSSALRKNKKEVRQRKKNKRKQAKASRKKNRRKK